MKGNEAKTVLLKLNGSPPLVERAVSGGKISSS
jgi:hypothetical protein